MGLGDCFETQDETRVEGCRQPGDPQRAVALPRTEEGGVVQLVMSKRK